MEHVPRQNGHFTDFSSSKVNCNILFLNLLYSLLFVFLFTESIDKDVVDDTDQQPRIRPSALPFLIFSSGVTFSLMCKTGAAASHQWNVNWRLPSTFHSDDYESAQVLGTYYKLL